MKESPKAILVIYSDVSEGVAKMLTSCLASKGNLVSCRNVRYGFNADMYKVVIAIGTKEVRVSKNIIVLPYKSYAKYQTEGGKLHMGAYHGLTAQGMFEELQESRLF